MSVVFRLNLKRSRSSVNPAADNGIYLKGDSGHTVLLIHGLTGTPNEMKSLAASLNGEGYSVICPRLANHGEPLHILKNTRWQDMYGSVKEAFASSGKTPGSGKVFVAGLSMGALLALALADEFGERISGVSCLAPTLFYDGWNTPASKYLLPLGYKTFLKHFFYFKEEPPYGIKNEAIQERIHKYYTTATLEDTGNVSQYGYPYFPISLLHQLQLLVKHVSRRLPYINTPVQLIQAKDDDMASVRNSKYIYDKIGSKDKEMILLYDSYHVITADQERHVVAAKVKDFFGKRVYNMPMVPEK